MHTSQHDMFMWCDVEFRGRSAYFILCRFAMIVCASQRAQTNGDRDPISLSLSLNVIKCALHMFARCSAVPTACSGLTTNTLIIKSSVYVATSMFFILFCCAAQAISMHIFKEEWYRLRLSLAPHISFCILICCNFITVKSYFMHFYGRRLSSPSPSTSLTLSRKRHTARRK